MLFLSFRYVAFSFSLLIRYTIFNSSGQWRYVMNTFKIGTTEFGIGDIELTLKHANIHLEVCANEAVYERITQDEDSEWGWSIYPPKMYFYDVPYENQCITIDFHMLDEYDIALYMMEHNGFIGTLEIKNNTIHVQGQLCIMGKPFPLIIHMDEDLYQIAMRNA